MADFGGELKSWEKVAETSMMILKSVFRHFRSFLDFLYAKNGLEKELILEKNKNFEKLQNWPIL